MPDEENQPQQEPVTYSSPVKRVWAWVGVVYMVMITLLFTYSLARASFLNGIGSLMLCPALAGFGVSTLVRYRTGQGKGGLPACIAVTTLSAVLLVYSLWVGIPALLAQLGG